jgi:NhaA family Na+:H+ antiporter
MPKRLIALPRALQRFIELEAAGGIVMIIAAALAILIANSPLAPAYKAIIGAPVRFGIGDVGYDGALKTFVKDVLMVLFFLAVGLELKREMVQGVLQRRDQIALPLMAAIGGMVAPALVFLAMTGAAPETLAAWAIPAATDIAFALAVLLIFGAGTPPALKVFLLAVAIFDDLGAILIIAFFYSSGIAPVPLLLAAIVVAALYGLNRAGIGTLTPYLLLGAVLSILLVQAGIHSTLGGVVTGLLVPVATASRSQHSPLDSLMHLLHPWVTYLVLPLFAFVGAGIAFDAVPLAALVSPLPLGIMLGLFVGKQLGITLAAYAAVKAGVARWPEGVGIQEVHAAAIVAGIGFTMSLFIGLLAFPGGPQQELVKVGVVGGSLLSAIFGALALRRVAARASSA